MEWPAMKKPSPLPDVQLQAEAFRQARQARRAELSEDYVELISSLLANGGEARQVDIAERLGVAQPTVARMLKKMIEDGLVQRKPYRGIFLTDAGRHMAAQSRTRHEIVEKFLLSLGIDAETALRDAEGIEHHVSARTLEAFRKFLERGH